MGHFPDHEVGYSTVCYGTDGRLKMMIFQFTMLIKQRVGDV